MSERVDPLGWRSVGPDVAGSTQVSPETGWVLACLRRRYAGEGALAPIPPVGLDWDVTVGTARRNAVMQLVEPEVRSLGDVVPRPIAEAFIEEARAVRMSNLEQVGELIRVLDLLSAAGIRALPYKGPLLAHVAYGDLGSRRFGDLDVLVARSDVRRVVDLLVVDGYDAGSLTPRRLEALLRHGHDWALTKAGRFVLEVQWAVADRAHARPRGVEPLLDRAATTSLAGREIPTLDPTDQVVVLAIHGGIHLWTRLAWVCDLAEALRLEGVDPDRALALARGVGASRMLLLGIHVVERVLRFTPVAELAGAARADADVMRLADELLPALLMAGGPDIRSPVARVGARVRLMDRRLDGVTGVARAVLTPRFSDWEAVRLPDALYPLYYLVRGGRLIAYAIGRDRGRDGVDVFDAH